MPTKKELKRLSKPIKMKLRKGDRVVIISGKDKGEIGFIAAVSPKENKVLVLKENDENPDQPLPLNTVIKHKKARVQGEKSARLRIPAPIDASNVMVLEEGGKATRVGRRVEGGKIVRFAKRSGKTMVDAEEGGK